MTESVTHAKRLAEVGEGVVDHQSLETASQMARPKQIWSDGATVPGTGADADWDSGSYVYDGAGNITAMGSQSFTYDKVSRLTFGNVAGYGSESYTYDPYGNLITSGGTSLPTATATNRLEPATTGAGYDAAGNLTALGLTPNVYAYTYDRFNQLASVSGPGINRSQATTADGERLFVRDGTTYLFTLRDLGGNVIRELEYTAAGGWKWRRDNIYRDSLLLASETRGEGLKHYHLDHLGSPRLVTNRTGEKLTLFATSPFGKDSSGSAQGTERMRFTVHERDLGSLTNVLDDIDYMHARSYTPRLGRFMSVDPVRGKARTPQSFNLHSYVRDRPMTSLDPNGMLAFVAAGGATAEDVAKAYEEQERLRKELSKALVKAYKEIFDVDLVALYTVGQGPTVTLTSDSDPDVKGINGRFKQGVIKLNTDRKLFDRVDKDGNSLFGATLLHEVGHWARKSRFGWQFRPVPVFPVPEGLRSGVMDGLAPRLPDWVRHDGPEGNDSEILQYGKIVTLQWGL